MSSQSSSIAMLIDTFSGGMASPDERKGENEALFRELNERLERQAVEKQAAGDSFEIVCECSLETCTQRLSVTFADYELVREDGTRFIVATGHTDPGTERIVSGRVGYDVVEKLGLAAEAAAERDPRDE
jgi:hypothetical protein